MVVIVGPADDVNPYGGTYRKWLLRSFVNKQARTVATQLYVEIGYVGGWRRYGSAADTTTHLSVARIGSRVDTCFGKGVCSLDETVGIQLDDAKLQANVVLGYQVTISARSGDSISITIEPQQIQAQLAALAKFGRLSPAAAPARAVARKATAQLFSITTSLICSTGDRSVYLGMSPRISLAWGPKPA